MSFAETALCIVVIICGFAGLLHLLLEDGRPLRLRDEDDYEIPLHLLFWRRR